MNFEDELEQRLGETANRIESSPDLSWVETEAGRRHKRQRRSPAALGALAVVALGLAGTAYLVGGSAAVDDSASDDPPSTDAVESADAAGSTGGAADTQSPSAPESVDPATPFLERTVEIYRRDIGDRQIVVRRSDLSWAELFDLEWRAPTGTAELCMGDRAIFIGDPAARGGYGGSAWTPIERNSRTAGVRSSSTNTRTPSHFVPRTCSARPSSEVARIAGHRRNRSRPC